MITTINEFKKQTMTLWHGGNLDDDIDDISHKSTRWEYGPGLYLTTSYNVVQKYSKGSRKLYIITLEKGVDLKDVNIPIAIINEFINATVIKNKIKNVNDAIERIQVRLNNYNSINGDTFLNVIINNNAIKNTDTIKLKRFFVQNGIDYNIVDNAFGWHERMVVLFNNAKILNVKRITSKDKIEQFDLPIKFNNVI